MSASMLVVPWACWGLIFGLLEGLIFGLIGFIGGQGNTESVETLRWSWKGAVRGLLGGLIFGLIFGLFDGLSAGLFDGLLGGLLGLSVGLVGILRLGLVELVGMLRVGLVELLIGLIFGGLLIGLFFGGLAVIQHLALRLILYHIGHIPWNYARFLDHAASLILLRKVGGGYIFINPLLLDHFAQLYQEQYQDQ